MEYLSKSDKETQRIAKDFAKTLKSGEVIGLIGDLGAGKTTFTQGLAKALGIKQNITSPTFVLMKVYPVKHPTIKHFCHIDAYRLKSYADLEAIGATEYVNAHDCVTVVEWAGRVKKILPKTHQIITLNNLDGLRIINIK